MASLPPQKLISEQLNFLARHTEIRWEHVPHSMACFSMRIRICSEELIWQVEFQFVGVDWVPDFIFPDQFNPFLPSQDHPSLVPHLLHWKMSDDAALYKIMKPLLRRFTLYQRELVEAETMNDRVLIHNLDDVLRSFPKAQLLYQPETRTVLILSGIEGLDLSDMGTSLAKLWNIENAMETLKDLQRNVQLRITVAISEMNKPRARLLLPPELAPLFGQTILPDWSREMHFAEYLMQVREALQMSYRSAGEAAELRKELILALAATSFGEPVELDVAGSRSAIFHINFDGLNWILYVDVEGAFPIQQPTLRLQNTEDTSFNKKYNSYPWSPRWTAKEMASRIKTFIEDVITDT